MRNKGCDVLKVIQDDRMNTERARDKSASNIHQRSTHKIDISTVSSVDHRSTSQSKTTRADSSMGKMS